MKVIKDEHYYLSLIALALETFYQTIEHLRRR